VVETDKDENTKQYNKYLQVCISANRSRSNPALLHPYSRKQMLRCLPFYHRLLFGYEKANSVWVCELIKAGETALLSKEGKEPSLVFSGYHIEFLRKIRSC